MPQFLYVALAGENKISIFSIDPDSGRLEFSEDVALSGGPGPLAVSPDQQHMYAGVRSTHELSSFRIDQRTGTLDPIRTISLDSDPCYISVDATGRYLLSAYYFAGGVSVHAIDDEGVAIGPQLQWISTAEKAHCIRLHSSNRFAFVPHVMTANVIFQFRFDPETGELTPNVPPTAPPPDGVGTRHFCFHPTRDYVYFDNEQASSVTAYRLDAPAGTVEPFQTVSTLPDGYGGDNSNAQIHITPSGDYVYASNRGHNSIAMFAVDHATGELTSLGQQPTVEIPRAFNVDLTGRFLYVSSLANGDLASYRIDPGKGTLTPLETYQVGAEPMWVLPLVLGE